VPSAGRTWRPGGGGTNVVFPAGVEPNVHPDPVEGVVLDARFRGGQVVAVNVHPDPLEGVVLDARFPGGHVSAVNVHRDPVEGVVLDARFRGGSTRAPRPAPRRPARPGPRPAPPPPPPPPHPRRPRAVRGPQPDHLTPPTSRGHPSRPVLAPGADQGRVLRRSAALRRDLVDPGVTKTPLAPLTARRRPPRGCGGSARRRSPGAPQRPARCPAPARRCRARQGGPRSARRPSGRRS